MILGETVDKSYKTCYETWDRYMAEIWLKVLTEMKVHPKSRVVEFAPGTSIKIGLALSKMKFQGELWNLKRKNI